MLRHKRALQHGDQKWPQFLSIDFIGPIDPVQQAASERALLWSQQLDAPTFVTAFARRNPAQNNRS
jgi:hypothetical protein